MTDKQKKIGIVVVAVLAAALVVLGIMTSINGKKLDARDSGDSIVEQTEKETPVEEAKEEVEKEEAKKEKKEEKKKEANGNFKVSEEEKKEEKSSSSKNTSDTQEEKKVYTPTFMYFVSNSDADYKKAMASVDSLKKEYGDKVKFDIINVDENPEVLENFPVAGQTPTVIMLNTNNDICAFTPKISDEKELKEIIDGAFEG